MFIGWISIQNYWLFFSRLRLTGRCVEPQEIVHHHGQAKAKELGQEILGLMAYVQTHAKYKTEFQIFFVGMENIKN